ncbi:SDR family oxidoreductase [uncultured Succiniclasticum sp.]|uniref:SDR family NAD(P)-dependent oxidoreductase n=1 Tax=uncultured Succiniclasticum sp. TaxID=1500547 RepID=UPI0025E4756B|nr:SDR family oxidoreductase [uncultured Succiniclasticum sp.]
MQNVLITGVSGGIGKGVVEKLLASGCSVIGLDRAIRDEVRAIAEQYPEKLFLQECDLMDVDHLQYLIKNLVAEYGPVGGFVHCAGFDKMAPLHLTKVEDIENLWRLHALVPMVMIAAISKKKNHAEGTSIVLISSQSAHEGAMGHTAYAAAKGAIEGYLAPAAAELMEKGIRINEVCFAPVKTPMAAGWMDKLNEEGMKKLLESYPLGIGEISDASNLICFLLLEESRWISGQIITADGGHSVRKV